MYTTEEQYKHSFVKSRKGRRPMRVAKLVEKSHWGNKNKKTKLADAYFPEMSCRYGDSAPAVYAMVEEHIKEASAYPWEVLDALERGTVDQFSTLCKEANMDPEELIVISGRYGVNPWHSLQAALPHEKVAFKQQVMNWGTNMMSKAKNIVGKGPKPAATPLPKPTPPKPRLDATQRSKLQAHKAKAQQNQAAYGKQTNTTAKQQNRAAARTNQGAGQAQRTQNLQAGAQRHQQQAHTYNRRAVQGRAPATRRAANTQARKSTQQAQRAQSKADARMGQRTQTTGSFTNMEYRAGSKMPSAPTPTAPTAPPTQPTGPGMLRNAWNKSVPWIAGVGTVGALGYGAHTAMSKGQQGFRRPTGYRPQGY